MVSLTKGGTWSQGSTLLSLLLRLGNSQGCCSPFSWSGELFEGSILSAGESQGLGNTVSIGPWCNLIKSADADGYRLSFTIPASVNQRSQLLNRICFYLQRALGSKFERRNVNGLAGKLIKPDDVEGQIWTPIDVRDISTRRLFHFRWKPQKPGKQHCRT
jgi:hypothetical protein